MTRAKNNHPLISTLAIHRKNVADLLFQQAIGFDTKYNRLIEIEREKIQTIKQQLKSIGIVVEDDPIDEDEDEPNASPLLSVQHVRLNKNDKEKAKMTIESPVDVVIITALAKERDAVLRHLNSAEETTVKNRTYYKSVIQHENGRDSYTVVLLNLSSMGNTESAVATTQAITIWNPSQIILAGIAGGIKKGDSRSLGDIVVGEQIVGYELGRISDGKTERRFQVLRPAHKLLEAARSLSPEEWVFAATKSRPDGSSDRTIPKVHFGVVASGEKVVADKDLSNELQSTWSQLIGIEMEGYGASLAAFEAETTPGMILVKGICDWADPSKNDDWQEYAADISAAFIVALLKRVYLQPAERQALRSEPVKYSGKSKFRFCERLGDSWEDLAMVFEIPKLHRARFKHGFECHGIWDWIEERNKMDGLEQALIDIDREDLIQILEKNK